MQCSRLAAKPNEAPFAPGVGCSCPFLVGALVSLSLGLLARQEAIAPGTYPGGYYRFFFSDSLHLKVWPATAALTLAGAQLVSAAWIFGKLPWPRPAWIPALHRWTGRLVFCLTLPVAYHCIFKLGFQKTDSRVLTHAFLGCAFYGAFAGKVLIDGSKQRKEKHPAAASVSGQDRSARRAGSVHTQPDCDGTARPPPCGARCR